MTHSPPPPIFGWTGRILRLDLGTGAQHVLRLPQSVYRRFLGGRGLGGYFLRQSQLDFGPLPCEAPELPLVIAAGPLTGTDAPASGHTHVLSRSPLTGAMGDATLGGSLGVQLKNAGWDALVLTGTSPNPCGLIIEDGSVRLTDATALVGLDTASIFTRLKAEGLSGALLATGPAAESGCRFASLVAADGHSAERTGLGRVAALKQLKYIAVHGTSRAVGSVAVADAPGLADAREDILRLAAASPALMGQHGFAHFGTGSLYDLVDSRRMMPTDNFARTHFPQAGSMNAHAYAARCAPRSNGCQGCHVGCGKIGTDGRALPDFQAMSHFSALLGNADLELVLAANALCVRLGLDPVSAAATLACHREITGKDFTAEGLLALLTDMATGTGEGAALAQGSARYAASQGRPELSMSVKGLELPAFDPRGAYGMALSYATSTRGACHLRACAFSHEILRKPVATDRFSFSGKARIIKSAEDAFAAADSLTICANLLLAASLEEYARAYAAVTGIAATAADLLTAGEAIAYQERCINAAYGLDATADDLPERFFTQCGSGNATLAVPPIPRQDFLNARAAYYRIRSLTENGLPTRETAQRLGLACGEEAKA